MAPKPASSLMAALPVTWIGPEVVALDGPTGVFEALAVVPAGVEAPAGEEAPAGVEPMTGTVVTETTGRVTLQGVVTG